MMVIVYVVMVSGNLVLHIVLFIIQTICQQDHIVICHLSIAPSFSSHNNAIQYCMLTASASFTSSFSSVLYDAFCDNVFFCPNATVPSITPIPPIQYVQLTCLILQFDVLSLSIQKQTRMNDNIPGVKTKSDKIGDSIFYSNFL